MSYLAILEVLALCHHTWHCLQFHIYNYIHQGSHKSWMTDPYRIYCPILFVQIPSISQERRFHTVLCGTDWVNRAFPPHPAIFLCVCVSDRASHCLFLSISLFLPVTTLLQTMTSDGPSPVLRTQAATKATARYYSVLGARSYQKH